MDAIFDLSAVTRHPDPDLNTGDLTSERTVLAANIFEIFAYLGKNQPEGGGA